MWLCKPDLDHYVAQWIVQKEARYVRDKARTILWFTRAFAHPIPQYWLTISGLSLFCVLQAMACIDKNASEVVSEYSSKVRQKKQAPLLASFD